MFRAAAALGVGLVATGEKRLALALDATTLGQRFMVRRSRAG